jgi:hypothetical protein
MVGRATGMRPAPTARHPARMATGTAAIGAATAIRVRTAIAGVAMADEGLAGAMLRVPRLNPDFANRRANPRANLRASRRFSSSPGQSVRR